MSDFSSNKVNFISISNKIRQENQAQYATQMGFFPESELDEAISNTFFFYNFFSFSAIADLDLEDRPLFPGCPFPSSASS